MFYWPCLDNNIIIIDIRQIIYHYNAATVMIGHGPIMAHQNVKIKLKTRII